MSLVTDVPVLKRAIIWIGCLDAIQRVLFRAMRNVMLHKNIKSLYNKRPVMYEGKSMPY